MRSTRLSKLPAFAVVLVLASSQLPARASNVGVLAATPRIGFNNRNSTHCRAELGLGMSRHYAVRDPWGREQQSGDGSLGPHAAAMYRVGAR